MFCDSQSAICLTKDQKFHERTKHIDVRYHYIRDVIAQRNVKVCKISTHDNSADTMTKLVPVTTFEFFAQAWLVLKFSPRDFRRTVVIYCWRSFFFICYKERIRLKVEIVDM